MKQYRITVQGHVFDVKVLGDPRQEQVRVDVDGEVFTVGVETVQTAMEVNVVESKPVASLSAATPSGTISAPLPGVIKSIAVRPGQRVSFKDDLVTIEAMKMDNIIRAPRDGIIKTVHVTEGRQVAHGEPLLDMS